MKCRLLHKPEFLCGAETHVVVPRKKLIGMMEDFSII